jgi:hypothetical protein
MRDLIALLLGSSSRLLRRWAHDTGSGVAHAGQIDEAGRKSSPRVGAGLTAMVVHPAAAVPGLRE